MDSGFNNDAVARQHEQLESKLAEMVENGDPSEMTLTFDGDRITGSWMVPEMAPAICAICGKRCLERGLPLCVNANPFCG